MNLLGTLLATRRRKRSWVAWTGLAAVVLVPLAFAGLSIGALSQSDTSLERVPAAVVNNDTLMYTTDADGTKTPVFAGRQLVTELTSGSGGYDWVVTNDDQAKAALAAGDVSAILTVPADFSRSILSLGSGDPVRAGLTITTDDAHSYLGGTLASMVGESMGDAFGRTVTAQYIAGIRSGLGELGASLGDAASGAESLSTGAGTLSHGLTTLAAGVSSVHSGAAGLAGGIRDYSVGVDSLSAGLTALETQTAGIGGVSAAVSDFTGGISSIATALAVANAELQADPDDQVALAKVAALSAQLVGAASGGSTLATTVGDTLGGMRSGIVQSASGAKRVVAGSAALRSGADSLVDGLAGLAGGASTSAAGAGELAVGSTRLADGLADGAKRVPAGGSPPEDAAAAADVAADPVAVTVVRDNELAGVGQSVATFFVPLGLWVGALAVFLVVRPANRRELGSTAASGRLVLGTLARASAVTMVQAVLLVGLLHTVVGVSWAALPANLGFSLLMALAFTAFHYLLTLGLGRGGLVVSLFVLAIQVTATGGLYPVQVLATPFQWVSPLLPLSHGVSGMQGIVAGGAGQQVLGAVAVLALFGLGSALLALPVMRRMRGARALGLLPATMG